MANVHWGTRLRQVREGRGLSQHDLAVAAGTTLQTIGAIERGRQDGTNTEMAVAIARALDVSLDYLLTGNQPGETDDPLVWARSQGLDETDAQLMKRYVEGRRAAYEAERRRE